MEDCSYDANVEYKEIKYTKKYIFLNKFLIKN